VLTHALFPPFASAFLSVSARRRRLKSTVTSSGRPPTAPLTASPSNVRLHALCFRSSLAAAGADSFLASFLLPFLDPYEQTTPYIDTCSYSDDSGTFLFVPPKPSLPSLFLFRLHPFSPDPSANFAFPSFPSPLIFLLSPQSMVATHPPPIFQDQLPDLHRTRLGPPELLGRESPRTLGYKLQREYEC
jgi:hypothetical protein